MSFTAMANALRIGYKLDLKPYSRYLLLLLADAADNETYTAEASISYLQKASGIKPDTIRSHLRILEETGLITVKRERIQTRLNRTNRYTLLFGGTPEIGGTPVLPKTGLSTPDFGGTLKEKVPPKSGENPSISIKPKDKDPKKEKTWEDYDRHRSVALPPNVSREDWNDWIDLRARLRIPLSDTAVKRTLGVLSYYGGRAGEMIEQAIIQNWKGFKREYLSSGRNGPGTVVPSRDPAEAARARRALEDRVNRAYEEAYHDAIDGGGTEAEAEAAAQEAANLERRKT